MNFASFRRIAYQESSHSFAVASCRIDIASPDDPKTFKPLRQRYTIFVHIVIYCSVLGKRPWALKHKWQFWPAWALTRDITSMRLYRSCYIDPMKCGAWALTQEWALGHFGIGKF